MSGDDLGPNSVMPKFGGRGTEKSKTQNLTYLSKTIEHRKLCIVLKNQPPKSITRGDMKIHPLLALKKCGSTPISPPD